MRPPIVRILRRASHTLLWSTLEKPPSLVDRGSLRLAGCPSRLVRYRTGSPQTQRCWQRLHRLHVDQVTDVRRPACGGCCWRLGPVVLPDAVPEAACRANCSKSSNCASGGGQGRVTGWSQRCPLDFRDMCLPKKRQMWKCFSCERIEARYCGRSCRLFRGPQRSVRIAA
jgi:hypothetical protein